MYDKSLLIRSVWNVLAAAICICLAHSTAQCEEGIQSARLIDSYRIPSEDDTFSPQSIVISNDEKFLFVADARYDAMFVFVRGLQSGILKLSKTFQGAKAQKVIAGAIVVDNMMGPSCIAVSPDDSRVYVSCKTSNSIVVLQGDKSFGARHVVQVVRNSESGVRGLDQPEHIATSSDGAHIYVACASQDTIVQFENARDGNLVYVTCMQLSGALSPIEGATATPAIAHPIGLVCTGDGRFVYSANYKSNSVCTFSRNASNGELTLSQVVQDSIRDGLRGCESFGRARKTCRPGWG